MINASKFDNLQYRGASVHQLLASLDSEPLIDPDDHWDDLRFFVALARAGTVRGAATRLAVNHSTVSRRIARLEERLGIALVERLPSGVALTPDGEEVLRVGADVSDTLDALNLRLGGRDHALEGELCVTLPPLISSSVLMDELARFSERHPGIRLELMLSYEVLSLARREADVALRIAQTPPPDGLVGRKLITYARADYATPAYLAAHDPAVAPEDCRWIGWNEKALHPDWVRASDHPDVAVWHRMDDAASQVAAAKAGLGIASLPCFLCDPEPALVRVPPGRVVPAYDLWLLTHADIRQKARVRAFIDFMGEAFERHRDLFEGRRPDAPPVP